MRDAIDKPSEVAGVEEEVKVVGIVEEAEPFCCAESTAPALAPGTLEESVREGGEGMRKSGQQRRQIQERKHSDTEGRGVGGGKCVCARACVRGDSGSAYSLL